MGNCRMDYGGTVCRSSSFKFLVGKHGSISSGFSCSSRSLSLGTTCRLAGAEARMVAGVFAKSNEKSMQVEQQVRCY